MGHGKGKLTQKDVQHFAKEHSFPEEYVRPFYTSLRRFSHLKDKSTRDVTFRVFSNYVEDREKALHNVFDVLDRNKWGYISEQDMRIGLRHLTVRCQFSRCSYRPCSKAVDGFFASHLPSDEHVSFKNFRKYYLQLPNEIMNEQYWLKAGDPACCDLRCSLPHAESPHKPSASAWAHLLAGATAGAASRTATAPLETLRLMAMTGALQPVQSAGHLYLSACNVAKMHGWRALYRGNLANVARSAPQKALDFFAFDAFKNALSRPQRGGGASAAAAAKSPGAAAAAAQPGTAATLAAAGLAGAMSNVILFPLEVVRTRLSTDTADLYKGVGHAFRTIWHQEGPRALYRGLGPSVLAILPEAAITYGLFDILKRCYTTWSGRTEAGVAASLAAGVIAAFTGQAIAYPLETVSRRMQMCAAPGGASAALATILHDGGVRALFRGLGAASLRVVPMAIVSFGTYEFVRLHYTRMEDHMHVMAAQRQCRAQCGISSATELCAV